MIRSAGTFAVCFVLWLVLSGHPSPLHLVEGVLAAAFVAFLNRDLEAVSTSLRAGPRFLVYLPWLIREILVANIQVARIVLDPRLPIDPVLVRRRTRLRDDLAVTTFANSITLTPGTVTVDVEGRDLVVHALTRQTEESFSTMERHVAEVFGEASA